MKRHGIIQVGCRVEGAHGALVTNHNRKPDGREQRSGAEFAELLFELLVQKIGL